MFIYVPNEVTDAIEKIKIFIPYTKIQPATLIALLEYKKTLVKLKGQFGYSNYFKDRWKEQETFISIEHDIVVWPGAIEAIWDCPEELCTYDIHLLNHRQRNLETETHCIPPGCIKISKSVMQKSPHLWDKPVKWGIVDKHLIKCGVKVHQHFPSVVHANPVFLKPIKGIMDG